MNEHYSFIFQERKSFLNDLIIEKSKALKKAPAGTLNISHCRGTIQYYLNKGDGTRPVYISVKDIGCIRELAQKDYDIEVLKRARRELLFINKSESHILSITPEDVYEALSDDRKALVTPIILSDDDYVKEWKAEKYQGSTYMQEFLTYATMNGEMVRSKSESIIADHLYSKGVPYRYEAPLALKGHSVIYPDFTVLNVKHRRIYYHEHFGMMDNGSYADKAMQRINLYQSYGLYPGESLITTFESGNNKLDIRLLDQIIEKFYLS